MGRNRFFGYWIAVHDDPSAYEAVRMSGLPVLIMGANAALLGLITFVQPEPDLRLIVCIGVIALLLIIIAFRLRSGHAAWVPYASVLFVAFLIVSGVFSYLNWISSGFGQLSGGQVVMGWIVPIFCTVLAIGGGRGWLWLRAHKRNQTF